MNHEKKIGMGKRKSALTSLNKCCFSPSRLSMSFITNIPVEGPQLVAKRSCIAKKRVICYPKFMALEGPDDMYAFAFMNICVISNVDSKVAAMQLFALCYSK